MTLVLLTWFLIAPSLPGADADARLVAGRLRPRVARMLAAPALVAVLLWLGGCLFGVFGVVLAGLVGAPRLAAVGPAAALAGAFLGGILLLAVGLRERVWVKSLGLPADWRGPWLAGELREHFGGRRGSPPGAAGRSIGRAPSPAVPPLAQPCREDASLVLTPVERWRPSPADPTEVVSRATADDDCVEWAEEQIADTVLLRIAPHIPGVRYFDPARLRTPPMAEG